MPRLVIIGVVVGVAFTLYGLVDAAMTDRSRVRGISKPAWVLVVILLPVIGAALWFTIGKDRRQNAVPEPIRPPDDDPAFGGGSRRGPQMSAEELDAHVRELEERLRELDDETFPGEDPRPGGQPQASAAAGAEPEPEQTPPDAGPASGERTAGEHAVGDADDPRADR